MDFNYKVIFSKRRTATISIERDSSVLVRAPEGISTDKLDNIIEQKKLWIYEQSKEKKETSSPKMIKEFVNGETVFYLGNRYTLDIVTSDEDFVEIDGRFITCGSTREKAKEVFINWFLNKANETIPSRVDYYADRVGVDYKSISISALKYTWGSCSPSGALNFNWQLIKAPSYVIDYVIVHEVAHLLELNHTAKFWQIVKTQLPHYLKSKAWLKENGRMLEDDF